MATKSSHALTRTETTPDENVRREATPNEIEAAVTSLHDIWRAGTKLRPVLKSKNYRFGNKKKLLTETAKREGIKFGFDTLGKAVRIASEYTRPEIAGICDQVYACKSRFGATHLIRLLTVAKKRERQRLLHEAIQRRWMTFEVQQATWRTQKRRRPCGRLPIPPEDELTCAIALGSFCVRWRRWMDSVEQGPGLPAPVQRKAKAVTESILDLERLIDKYVSSARKQQKISRQRRP